MKAKINPLPVKIRNQGAPRARVLWALALGCLAGIGGVRMVAGEAELEQSFRQPPREARPGSFWPWIGGHITREGIRADLEAMKASGMRGGIIFDLSLYIPESPLAYGSPEWQELVDYAITTGHGMGLEIGFQNCPGWATSGGPWVTPEDSMKRMVFSETKVEAPHSGPVHLPLPGNIREEFYRDVAVLAVPEKMRARRAQIDLSGRDVSDLQEAGPGSAIPVLSGEPVVFLATFESVTTVSSWAMEVIGNAAGSFEVTIESSLDGVNFTPVAEFMAGGRLRGRTPLTESFAPVEGQVFRITMVAPLNRGNVIRFQVARLNLLPDQRIPNFAMMSMGAASAARQFHPRQMPSLDSTRAIDPAEVLDLTDRLSADGSLAWTPPAGSWTVLRFGYTSTGATNHPAREGGQGLEVDKMDADAVRRFFAAALTPVLQRNPGMIPVIGIDSWEAGVSNWTSGFPEAFQARRGYHIRPFLPVLTGRIVGSPAESFAFLQDFRVTITELVAENYHRVMQAEAHKHGSSIFLEPYPGWNMDEFKSSRYADLVAAEFWIHDIGDFGAHMSSVRRTSAMVETIREDKRLSAEAFTGRPANAGWRVSPRSMKRVADSAMINGVNDFTFHSFVHQPRDDMRPGFTHGRYGTEFGRHNTWWPMAGAFHDYLARCGLLLRQGSRVADFLFLKSEGPFMDDRFPEVPRGYEFLYIAPFTLLESTLENGRLITPGGGRHPALVVPAVWVADLPLLDKLIELQEGGVAVLGGRPVMPAGRNDLARKAEWDARVARLLPGAARAATTASLAGAMEERGIGPDFSSDEPAAALEYAHRRIGDRSIYFVRNAGMEAVSTGGRFRVAAGRARFWDALDGSVRPAQMTVGEGGYRTVPLDLPPLGSVFVVFEPGQAGDPGEIPPTVIKQVLPEDWRVRFLPPGGEPFERDIETPGLWNESGDDAVKFFSGTAVYTGAWEHPGTPAGQGVRISLGVVHDMARVRVNGREAGVCWTPPDQLDITPYVRPGRNILEIEVAGTWVNRLIGDEHLPQEAEFDGISGNVSITAGVLKSFPAWYENPELASLRRRSTFAAWRHYDKNSPLVPAGLAGPVVVEIIRLTE